MEAICPWFRHVTSFSFSWSLHMSPSASVLALACRLALIALEAGVYPTVQNGLLSTCPRFLMEGLAVPWLFSLSPFFCVNTLNHL